MSVHDDWSDDPRLSAFACGELEGAERELVARLVAANPAAAAAVEELRGAARSLERAFASEPSFALTPAQRAAIARAAALSGHTRVRRGPATWVALAAAAGLAVTLTVRAYWPGESAPDARWAGRAAASMEAPLDAAAEPRLEAELAATLSAAVEVPERLMLGAPDAGRAPGAPAAELADEPPVRAQARAEEARRGAPGAPPRAKATAPAPATAPATAPALGPAGAAEQRRPSAPEAAPRLAGAALDGAALRTGGPFLSVLEVPRTEVAVTLGGAGLSDLWHAHLSDAAEAPEGAPLEDWLNAFEYAFAAPAPDAAQPLAARAVVTAAPWQPGHRLVHVTLRAQDEGPKVGSGPEFGPEFGPVANVSREPRARAIELTLEWDTAQIAAVRFIGDAGAPGLLGTGAEPGAGGAGGAGALDLRGLAAGQALTALFEVALADPAGVSAGLPTSAVAARSDADRALGVLRVHYVHGADSAPAELTVALRDGGAGFAAADDDTRFAASVAAFVMVQRSSPHRGSATLARVRDWAAGALGADPGGQRTRFLRWADRASGK